MTFDQWFQLRLDSLRRQNEWRKIDCLLFVREYVQDAFGFVPPGYALVPVEPTEDMGLAYLQAARIHAADGSEDVMRFSYGGYKAMLSAA